MGQSSGNIRVGVQGAVVIAVAAGAGAMGDCASAGVAAIATSASQPRTGQMIPIAVPARWNMPMMVCTCSALCSAHSEQRNSVMPAGVAGGRARLT